MWLEKILKRKEKKEEKKKIIVLYQAKKANLHLPPGAEALRVKLHSYRCGMRGPCPRDGKVHQELHRREVKKRCSGPCEYLETIFERR